jgi:hypothetical protein
MQYYYALDGSKFHSKIEALEYGIKNNQKIFYYYYDHVYEKLDWTIEPTHSLDYYYLEQAKRIRDTYDYVILCYSGGYDSSNILETFHFNNIRLDKIVVVGALEQDKYNMSDENHNGELYYNVFPYLKELNLDGITQVIDYSKLFEDINNFSTIKYEENWIDVMGGWFSPHHFFWRDLEEYVIPKEWKDKRVALVFGRDKPSLFSKDHLRKDKMNGFYFRDTPVTSYGNISSKNNYDRINFYWDPNYTDILIKQLHVLRRFNNTSKHNFHQTIPISINSCVDSIVYNLKRPILFKSPKSKSGILSLRDTFLNEKKNSDIYDFYNIGITKMNERIGQHKLGPIFSKFYDLTINVQK